MKNLEYYIKEAKEESIATLTQLTVRDPKTREVTVHTADENAETVEQTEEKQGEDDKGKKPKSE